MKKIFLIVIFLMNLAPSIKEGRIKLVSIQYIEAQQNLPNGCQNMGNPTSGGSFWTWLGNVFGDIGGAIGNAATAVGNAISDVFSAIGAFFSGNPGEGPGEEGGGDDWMPGGNTDPWTPDPTSYDPWNDPYFQNYGFEPNEWELLQNLGSYYETYVTTGGNYTSVSTPDNPRYYIQSSYNLQKRYYDSDTMYVPAQAQVLGMVFKNENTPYTVNLQDTKWKRNDSTKCTEAYWCSVDVSQPDTSVIKIDSADITTLIQTQLIVYRIPTIIFERGDNYDGEYAFDDSSHKHASITGNPDFQPGTETTTINGTSYIVPWMSLLDNQTATIKVKKLNLSAAARRDPAFKVTLQPSSDKIKLNGSAVLDFTYDQLNALSTLNVSAKEWIEKADSLKVIGNVYAITNLGDTIGKLNLSCAKPEIKNIIFVYVNTGSGYPNKSTGPFSKQAILDRLNTHSHNQLMRQWVLDASYNYLDTIDLTNEYAANPAKFLDADTIAHPRYINTYFYNHKGIRTTDLDPDPVGVANTSNSRSKSKRHVIFVFTYTANSNVGGIATTPGVVGCFFSQADNSTFSHEPGHLLSLNHTFDSPYNIPQYSTQNIMDYSLILGGRQDMFFFCQWTKIW